MKKVIKGILIGFAVVFIGFPLLLNLLVAGYYKTPEGKKVKESADKEYERIIAQEYGEEDPKPNEKRTVHVERVIDGDTFVYLDPSGAEKKVRLIGVDTPESVASDEYLEKTGKENTEEGKTASEFTKSLIEGQDVTLEFDVEVEDWYDRRLAYVFLPDGQMLQDILLKEGYANLATVQPNVKYVDHFVEVVQNRE